MDKKIKIILEDLYAIDESFKENEKELIEIINKLLVSRPDTKFDKKFARKLRVELLQKNKNEAINNLFYEITNMFTMKKISYAGAGIAVIALAIIIWQGGLLTPNETKFAFAPEITKVGKNAFGNLSNVQAQSNEVLGKGAGSAATAPTALNDSVAAKEDKARSQSSGGGGAASESMIIGMPNPYSVNYKFIYQGDELNQDKSTIEVLKRVKGDEAAKSLARQIGNLNFGNLNLGSFSDLRLQNINFTEDRDYGYMININPQEGMISIYQNWQTWPQPADQCAGDQACYEKLQIKKEDVPADEVLIKIADKFVKERGIDMNYYNSPVVDQSWKQYNAEYANDIISVIYPLLINGEKVYEESGQLYGLYVGVNIRENKVASIWNYTSQDYLSSEYEAETDFSRIVKFAEQGGRYRRYWNVEGEEEKEIKLGTPEIFYVKIWQYANNENNELLVPAMIFPIIDRPEGFYMQNVIVPLSKEILDEAERQGDNEPVIRPMPGILEDSDVESAPVLKDEEISMRQK